MIALDGLPGVAQVAIQGGRHVAGQVRARLAGRPDGQPFEYHDKGSMATISRFSAVASVGRLRVSGLLAWLMWLGVHLVYLIGFKNRLTTLLHWAVSFVGRGRSERTVTQQQIFARQALDQLGDELFPTMSQPPEQDPPP
jgi:NADH dehydrogenase